MGLAEAGTIEAVTVNKSGNTLTLSDALTCASFTGTLGTMDPNGQTVTTTGACGWASGFDFANAADAMNGCSWVVGGNWTGDSQTMRATAEWFLTVTGTAVATVCDFAYCNALNGTQIDADDRTCTNSGNNKHIDFIVRPFIGYIQRSRYHIQGAL